MYLVNLAEKTKHFLGKSEMCHFSGVKGRTLWNPEVLEIELLLPPSS